MADESDSESPDVVHPDENGNEGGGSGDNSNVRWEKQLLPVANVGRIMRKGVPPQGKIAKDSKEMMQECVSEFIAFITIEANDHCQRENRKTVNGDDLLWAMKELGFDDYVEVLKIYLRKYRETAGGRDQDFTMEKPGDADTGNEEGAGPPISPAVQMGPASASVYGVGMPYTQPQMLPMMTPSSSQIDMPPQMIAPGNYHMDMPPPPMVPENNQVENQMMGAPRNQYPTMVRENAYQMQNLRQNQMMGAPGSQHPMMARENYQMQDQMMGAPRNQYPTMARENAYQMQNLRQNQMMGAPGSQHPMMARENYQMQDQMMGAPRNQYPTMARENAYQMQNQRQNQMMGPPGNQRPMMARENYQTPK